MEVDVAGLGLLLRRASARAGAARMRVHGVLVSRGCDRVAVVIQFGGKMMLRQEYVYKQYFV